MKSGVFRMNEVYREEAVRLLSSRKRSKVIHSAGDIDASGDEIEVPFREFLRRRLPNQYFVGHGHVVDRSLNVNPQFDVIIADCSATPILFEGENGSQFFPWESVYAIGEIKSTYVKSKRYISKFGANIEGLKKRLTREPTPPSYIGNGVYLGTGLSTSEKREFRNPLFQFGVFFDSGDATQESLADEYSSVADSNLPAVCTFLDGSVIVKAALERVKGGIGMGSIDTDPIRIAEQSDIYWMRSSFSDVNERGGQALAVFMLGLFNHLQTCVLMDPPILDYLQAVIESAPNRPEPLSLSGMIRATELAGDELPQQAREFLERRIAQGKSPFSKVTVLEVEEFRKQRSNAVDDGKEPL